MSSDLVSLEKMVKRLEQEIELLRVELVVMDRKNCKDIGRLFSSLSAHRSMLMDLKPVYDEFRSRRVENVLEVDRSYG